jgi:death-on-curing protein
MKDPDFLTVQEILGIHEDQIESYGGAQGVRDLGLLESAALTAQASFDGNYLHTSLFEMAAAHAFHIAENQPFLDGNKRTGLVAALVFLALNGIEIDDSEVELYGLMIAVSRKQAGKVEIAKLLEALRSS